MSDINKIDLTDVEDSQKGLYQLGFELTDYANGASITLEASRSEFIGQSPYRVEDGNLSVPDPGGLSDGAVFLYVTEDGDGTASATLSNTAPTYSSTNGGYYNGLERALFVFTKSGANFNDRYRMSEVNKDLGSQMGQIIDIHPDVIKKPNAFNFALCNNTVALPVANFSTLNDTNAPDLNNKFLKTGSVHGLGGANTVNLQHSHDHNHQWYKQDADKDTDDKTSDSGGSEKDIDAVGYGSSGTGQAITSLVGKGTTAIQLGGNNYTDNDSTTALSSTQDNQPEFFVCLKYMRIN